MKNILLNNVSIVASAVVLLFISSCSGGGAEENANSSENEKVQVKTETVSARNVEQDMDFTANIEPFESNYISPSNPGRINKILVETGDRIKKGELLVQMDRSQYRQSRAQLENLEKEYARLDTLHRAGSISQQQLDQMRTELEVARTSFENLQENTQLRSPLNGIVTGRFYENGEMYNMAASAAGKPGILSVMQIDPVKARIYIPESFFPGVKEGMPVNLKLDVYPDTLFKGSVYLKYPTIDAASRTFTIETKFPNSDYLIRPGMFGRINMVFETKNRVLVPDIAVQRQEGTNEKYVFVIENGQAERKTIKEGKRVGGYYEVLEGLTQGEKVVIAGQVRLLEGTEVEVIQ